MARARKRAERIPLTRDRIEAAALKVIEADGLDAFSVRRLAAELGCEAMSIYHHFPSKAHIMDGLVDRFVGETPVPQGGDWESRVRQLAEAYRATALRYPELYRFVLVHRLNTAAGLRWLDDVVGVFMDAGFDRETTARIFRAIGDYVGGAVLSETAGYARGPSAAEPVPDEIAARDCPRIAAINPWFKPAHHKATFDFGLDIMLAGIARIRAAEKRAARR